MDHSSIIGEAFQSFWWLIPVVLVGSILRSPWFKGMLGESIVKFVAKLRLPKEIYHPIHNVTLQTVDGTTQIDHIFVSRYGIFVVETKNMKGWIFGNEKQAEWTQKIFKNNFKFQNPLRQNYKHTKALEAALNVPPGVIHSVIVFVGDCTFKTKMPANVTQGGKYISYIKSFKELVLTQPQVLEVVEQIRSGRLEPSRKTSREHVQRLKSRSDPFAERKCPKCGSKMVLRTTKRGPNAGDQFWGCSAYPKCRMVQKIS